MSYNSDYFKQYYKDNKKQLKQYHKQYYIDNRNKALERSKQQKKRNPEYCKSYSKLYYKENQEIIRNRSSQWVKDNPDKHNAHGAKRRATKLDQTPSNANLDIIQFYYTVASTMADYEVDHIKPLSKGGLHHEDNLQLLEKSLNRQKSNKWPLSRAEKIRYKGITI